MPDCSFFENENIEITRWKIEVCSFDGESIYYLSPENKTITVKTPENLPVSVTVKPLISFSADSSDEVDFFSAAGGIYPYDYDNSLNSVPLSWENGYAAYIMQQLYKGENPKEQKVFYIQSFNWKNLLNNILEKIKSSESEDNSYYFNPWLCDTEKILTNISSKSFKALNLNNSNCQSIELDNSAIFSEIENSGEIYSSFLPENQIIRQKNKFTIDTSKTNFFLCKKYYLVIKGGSSKNVSTAIVKLPIFNDGL